MAKAKTIKVSKEIYERLCEVAGKLQVKLKHPVSLDEALEYLLREKKLKISDFAGVWIMTDEEEGEILKSLREGWLRWKSQKEWFLILKLLFGLLRNKLNDVQLVRKIEVEIATTTINAFEIYFGAYKSRNVKRNLTSAKGFLSTIKLLPFDDNRAELAG